MIFAECDVLLGTLDSRMKAPCFPGKLMNIFSTGNSVIAIVPDNCETAKVLRKHNIGSIIQSGDNEQFKNKLIVLKSKTELDKFNINSGKEFVQNYLNLENNVEKYEIIVNEKLIY